MRLFANLVYWSFFVRLWLLALNKPVNAAATIIILALTLLCLLVEVALWVRRAAEVQRVIDRVVSAKLEELRRGERKDA